LFFERYKNKIVMKKETVINIDNIFKKFKDIIALNGVSFEVEKGTIFGIFGPNGAGKTTIIRIISGILKPDSGRVYVKCKNLSYIPEELSLYKEEKVINILNYILSLKGFPKKKRKEEIEKWSSLLGIEEFFERKIYQLSKGQKKKVMFTISLLGDPDVIIMDEPFVGMDVEASEALKGITYRMKISGKTIIFSTHILELAEEMCEEVIIIKKGKIIEGGKIDQLKNKYSQRKWIVRYSGKIDKEMFQDNEIEVFDNFLRFPCDISLSYIIKNLEGRVDVKEIKMEHSSFKEIYLRILGEKDERNLQL